jgi:hypothetical protein
MNNTQTSAPLSHEILPRFGLLGAVRGLNRKGIHQVRFGFTLDAPPGARP